VASTVIKYADQDGGSLPLIRIVPKIIQVPPVTNHMEIQYFPTLRLSRGVDWGCQGTFRHRRTRRGGREGGKKQLWKTMQILGKTNKIRVDFAENRLNSGYSITIFHK
jgi:hypothetical protein